MELPHGADQDIDFMFTKLIVDDLEKVASFYKSVFGLIELSRVEAVIAGRPVVEVVYQPTYKGGPLFILANFPGDAPAGKNELILGFAATDLDACIKRVEEAGGGVVEIPVAHEGVPRHAFVSDPEGHVIQLSQRQG